MNVILASNSPRRRQLLGLTGLDFRIHAADVDETPLDAEPADVYVQRLAANKARAVGAQATPGSIVIAADTTVVDGNQILGKPVDNQDAARMLRQLRGRTHQVYTAIAVLRDSDLILECCGTDVPMREYSDAEMQTYIESGDPLDKAGAYAIQHAGFHPVESLQGCYANVVGLPLCHLARALRKFEIEMASNLPLECQSTIGYECPIYQALLQIE
ncbi:MAG: Maf family protein [Anaerolineales bacterium]|jgi:septum formation protein